MDELSATLKIVIFIILALLTAWPYFENIKKYPFWKSLSIGVGIVILVVFGVMDILNSDSDAKEASKAIKELKEDVRRLTESDSTRKEREDRRDKKEDFLFDAVASKIQENKGDIDKGIKQDKAPPFALIKFTQVDHNPYFQKNEQTGALTEKFTITNYGTGDAFNFSSTRFFATLKNGVVSVQKDLNPYTANKTMVMPPGATLPGQADVISLPQLNDTVYLCYKMDFSDSTKKRKSFTKIYMVDFKKLEYFEAQDADYNRVENFLIKNKYWKPPFKQ